LKLIVQPLSARVYFNLLEGIKDNDGTYLEISENSWKQYIGVLMGNMMENITNLIDCDNQVLWHEWSMVSHSIVGFLTMHL
jgi:hypothetical protein